jgi:hypothetical protein
MFAGESRAALRSRYLNAWRKFCAHQPLEPLERQLAAVIREHPEYISWLEGEEQALAAEFSPERGESNPFLHMGLHLAIREQVATDRPAGIAQVHRQLAQRLGDVHQAEHAMLEVLAATLWEAQRNGHTPDEQRYLEALQRL